MSVAVAPISEMISREVYRRLLKLVNGYSAYSDVVEVIRPTRFGGFTPKDLQVVLTQSDPEIVEELSLPGNPPATAFQIRYNIRCHVMPDEDNATSCDEFVNIIAADVVRAVCSETDWHTMAGNAINSEWQTHENIDGDGSLDGVNVPLLVTFRTDENDPYNVRG